MKFEAIDPQRHPQNTDIGTNSLTFRLDVANPEIVPNMMFSAEGALLIRLINQTGHTSVKGELVEASKTFDLAVSLAAVNSTEQVGVVYTAGVVVGGKCWVAINGVTQVLLANSTPATHGQWLVADAVAGRALASNEPGTIARRQRSVGRCFETKAAGTNVLVYAVLSRV